MYFKYKKIKIRIISGKFRGRKLYVSTKIKDLRPTTSFIRETLFNWLTPIIQGTNCLDCFAGSGALGLEALSRYASSVTFLERNNLISNQLKNNLKLLHITKAKVILTDSLIWLNKIGEVFDIVFIDPPFRYDTLIDKIIFLLEKNKRLSQSSWIYIETKNNNKVPKIPVNWNLHREKKTGKIIYRLYFRKNI